MIEWIIEWYLLKGVYWKTKIQIMLLKTFGTNELSLSLTTVECIKYHVLCYCLYLYAFQCKALYGYVLFCCHIEAHFFGPSQAQNLWNHLWLCICIPILYWQRFSWCNNGGIRPIYIFDILDLFSTGMVLLLPPGPTTLRQISMCCPSSWPVSPSLLALSAPRWTAYR